MTYAINYLIAISLFNSRSYSYFLQYIWTCGSWTQKSSWLSIGNRHFKQSRRAPFSKRLYRQSSTSTSPSTYETTAGISGPSVNLNWNHLETNEVQVGLLKLESLLFCELMLLLLYDFWGLRLKNTWIIYLQNEVVAL